MDAGQVFSDTFWAHVVHPDPWEDYDFTGLTYRYNNATDLTVKSASGSSVYVDVTAENDYKIFDSAYTDDTFYGSTGTQEFKSYGGFDSVFGRAGVDYFRADGSFLQEDWGGADLYNAVGHNLFINDYEYGERISIEDFGLTRADQIRSQVDPAGYTDIIITVNGTEYTPVTVKGKYEYGVVYSRGDEHSDHGIDYGITFYDPSKIIGGTTTAFNGDDDLGLFGDVWETRA